MGMDCRLSPPVAGPCSDPQKGARDGHGDGRGFSFGAAKDGCAVVEAAAAVL